MNEIKLVLVGDGAVGKTCMLIKYYSREFPEYIPTVCDNKTQIIDYENQKITLNLYDTCGGDYNETFRPLSYPGTNVFILCFSVINHEGLNVLKNTFIPEIKHHCGEDVRYIIVGTKIDLRQDENIIKKLNSNNLSPITYEEGLKFSKEHKALGIIIIINFLDYCECSSLIGLGIDEVFLKACEYSFKSINRKKKKNTSIFSSISENDYDDDIKKIKKN
jgi:small GTP-binding protein